MNNMTHVNILYFFQYSFQSKLKKGLFHYFNLMHIRLILDTHIRQNCKELHFLFFFFLVQMCCGKESK